ncbi:hypothetical protein EV199_5010 [Pseudobacter ginsenosidimutans]|uniref:Uncharacterized protein n=1 Tax=Pseudobacter ginsenosidimutans TaxID=661488 RepID=A0A4Q7MQT1_9BACT|nr:hypothetical protein EV199_5010 [Pseudobacter ginsenosidimutans]
MVIPLKPCLRKHNSAYLFLTGMPLPSLTSISSSHPASAGYAYPCRLSRHRFLSGTIFTYLFKD